MKRSLSVAQFSVVCRSVTQSCLTLCDQELQHARLPLSSNSQSLLKLMSIELVMPSNHVILCCHLLLLPSIFPSIRVFSKQSSLRMRWPKDWSFIFSLKLPVNIKSWFPLGLIDLLSLLSKTFSRVFSNTTVQKHQFFGAQPSLWTTLTSVHDYWKKHSFDYMDICCQSDVSVF